MTEIRCSRCQFPAHLIFHQDWISWEGMEGLATFGWRGNPIVCPVCRRNER